MLVNTPASNLYEWRFRELVFAASGFKLTEQERHKCDPYLDFASGTGRIYAALALSIE